MPQTSPHRAHVVSERTVYFILPATPPTPPPPSRASLLLLLLLLVLLLSLLCKNFDQLRMKWNTHSGGGGGGNHKKKNWKKGEKRRRSVQQKRPTHHQCSLYHERITPIISNEIEKKKFEFFFIETKGLPVAGLIAFFVSFLWSAKTVCYLKRRRIARDME